MPKVPFTAGRIQSFTCPADRSQAFLWDTVAKGLGLRATPSGKPAYIFQGLYLGSSIRLTIGSPADWSIEQARGKAREFQRLIDQGMDPRQLKRDAIATQIAAQQEAQAKVEADKQASTPAADAWAAYLADRKPHWGDRHYADHLRLSQAGGQAALRGTRGRGVTIAGPLHQLLTMRLNELTPTVVEAWAAQEAALRPTVARLAWRQLKAFLSWCAEQAAYAPIVASSNPAKTRATRESLGKARTKNDALLREQLKPWFAAVRSLPNPTQSAYLQILLITGARPNEVLTLQRSDIDFRWNRLTIRDKVEGERQIPLTPYVKALINQLPANGSPWVFPGKQAQPGADAQPMSKPHHAHERACKAADIEHLTLHGLRRSFGTLSEWLEVPAGVIAQIQGHKPSATAEKHYRVRPLDLLRVHHERIEAWILEQAGIPHPPPQPPVKSKITQN